MAARLVLAARDMAAEHRRAAVLDRRHHLELAEAHMASVCLAPRRSMAAENVRHLQLWTCQERRALGRRLGLGLVLGLLLAQRREAIERAHHLADRVGGDARVERRRIELGMTQQSRDIMRILLSY
jgi:hypothetical protein